MQSVIGAVALYLLGTFLAVVGVAEAVADSSSQEDRNRGVALVFLAAALFVAAGMR